MNEQQPLFVMGKESGPKSIAALDQEISAQASFWGPEGEGNDPVMLAFTSGLRDSLRENSTFRTMVEWAAAHRPYLEPDVLFNIIFRASQKQFINHVAKPESSRRFLNDYPYRHTQPMPWKELFELVSEPSTAEHDDFYYDIFYRDLQSSKLQRAIGSVIVRQAAMDRLGEHPIVVEEGCGPNILLKQQAIDSHYRADLHYILVAPEDKKLPIKAAQWPVDLRLTRAVNKAVSTAPRIGRGIGVDIQHAGDTKNKEWARACAFYGGEYMDEDEVADYEMMEMQNPDNVDFYQADIANLDTEKMKKELSFEKVGLVTIPTVLNQLHPNDRKKAISSAIELLEPDGLIAVQDFVRIHPRRKSDFKVIPRGPRTTGAYRLFVIDPRDSGEEIHHIATFDNGRCNRVQFQPAIRRFGFGRLFSA